MPSIRKTAELVQEITASSEEQSAGAGQINIAMSQISQTTQQNASASEELSATAEEMNSQAEQLQRLVAQFRLDPQAQLAGGDGGAARPARAHAASAHASRAPRRIGPGNPQPAFAAAAADPEYVRF